MAYFLFHKQERILKILFSVPVQIVTYLITIGLIAKGIVFPFFHYEIYATLFSVILVNLAGNQRSILRLENRFMDYLGKISYGLYMYHILCIVVAVKLLELALPVVSGWHIYTLSILLAVATSALSYETFEKWFIRKKKAFTKILSGDNAH